MNTHNEDYNGIVVFKENSNEKIFEIKPIDEFPSYSQKIDKVGLVKIKDIAQEALKGMVNIPNSSLEVVFKPHIAQGLEDGTFRLLRTKEGELLADAVDVTTGKIVGKARLETNSIKQLSTAGFHLLSFAVAQSHLADISCQLNKIEGLCKDLTNYIEDSYFGDLEGELSYLNEVLKSIHNFASPEECLSAAQIFSIERQINKFYTHCSRFKKHFDTLIKNVRKQQNIDTFGTESTFHELKYKQKKYDSLLKIFELITRMYIYLKLISGYVEPYPLNKRVFTPFESVTQEFFTLAVDLQKKYEDTFRNKVNEILNATTNFKETITTRRDVLLLNLELRKHWFESMQANRIESISRLDNHLEHIRNAHKNKIKYALKLDENSEIIEASLV